MASRSVTKSAIPITSPNVKLAPADSNGNGNGSPTASPPGATLERPASTTGTPIEVPRPTAVKPPENTWTSLDMGGINLKNLPPTSGLFSFSFLIHLYLNHNALSTVPPEISKLRHLELLDLSGNNLNTLPPELGMLTQLKEFYLYDNHLNTIPSQFGSLHHLQTLGVEGNPLDPMLKAMVQKDGTQALISYLRDNCPVDTGPPSRPWKPLISPQEQELIAQDPNAETCSVLCYNILCEKYATEKLYGYTPSWALPWSYRKGRILDEVTKHDTDFVCLQEVDIAAYEDYFTVNLAQQGYEGVYWPKSRYKTMNDTDRRQVDGCATFYKADKYKLVEKRLIEFSAIAMQRSDFKKTDDMFNRVLGKDHIATVCLLENIHSGTRFILANAHIHWEHRDVKLVQVAILVDEIEKIAEHFAKYPPPPPPNFHKHLTSSKDTGNSVDNSSDAASISVPDDADPSQASPWPQTPSTPAYKPPPLYSDGMKIPLIICGDFNSTPDSGVYEFLTAGTLSGSHEDFMSHKYGRYTSEGIRHRLGLKSTYATAGTEPVTNHTPTFREHIDYIWYSTANLAPTKVLGEVDPGYLSKIVGFPHPHFPSDHIAIASEFRIKPPRETVTSRQHPNGPGGAAVATPVKHS
jgi:CCR4-NOT transcription complex subunit 6